MTTQNVTPKPLPSLIVCDEVMSEWQGIVDLLARIIQVPTCLIMRHIKEDIEVFVASKTEGNPYSPGDHEHLEGSGLYCETVIKSRNRLLVPNALKDDAWKNNPDIKLNMISYLGFPILLPDGNAFGTLCVLDTKENAYNADFSSLMQQLCRIIEANLEIIWLNEELGDRYKRLSDYLDEIQTLRGLVTICAFCKRIRDKSGDWQPLEEIVGQNPHTRFSHTYCPECLKGKVRE